MGVYKELDITYREIVDREAERLIKGISNNPNNLPYEQTDNAEKQIWRTIGTVDYDLADELTNEYPYEAALVCIERGEIPADNPEWQRLVVALAYNAITDIESFQELFAHSRFHEESIQQMLDLAAGAVLQNPNFRLTGFREIAPQS